MYERNTILALKEPHDADPETGEDFPYNRVRVVGESPVSHAHKGEWTGANARGVIIVPLTNFGATLDEPFGKLREIYDVEEIPSREIEAPAPVRVINRNTTAAGPTPEEIFAKEAAANDREKVENRAARRARQASPLGEPGGPKGADGPLGKAPSQRTRKPKDS